METSRTDFPWIRSEGTTLVDTAGSIAWWTFAGRRANEAIAGTLTSLLAGDRCVADNLQVTIQTTKKLDQVESAINELRALQTKDLSPDINEDAIAGLKFSECLPTELAIEMLERRMQDTNAIRFVLAQETAVVVS